MTFRKARITNFGQN